MSRHHILSIPLLLSAIALSAACATTSEPAAVIPPPAAAMRETVSDVVVTIDHVIVLVRPAAAAFVPDDVRALIGAAADDLIQQHGPVELAIYDHVRTRSASGEHTSLRDDRVFVRQRASAEEQRVLLDVHVEHERGRGSYEARVRLATERTVPLATSLFQPPPGTPFYVEPARGDAPVAVTAVHLVRAHVGG